MWVRCYKLVGVTSYKCGYDSWCGFVVTSYGSWYGFAVTSPGTIVDVGSLLQMRVR